MFVQPLPLIECFWSEFEPSVRTVLTTDFWRAADWQEVGAQWNGKGADPRWQTRFATRWTPNFIYFAFQTRFVELTMVDQPNLDTRTHELWKKEDVVEIFLNPDIRFPNRYKEFELSPSSQWIDIEVNQDEGYKNFEWTSGMNCRSIVERAQKQWLAEFRVPLRSLGLVGTPPGRQVPLNAYRIELKSKLYLAWSPTYTPQPDYHVPSRFGRMVLSR